MSRGDRGQVLVLFALMVTAVPGVMALVIELANTNTARRGFRMAADAAALAGAQDLQTAGTRDVSTAQRADARRAPSPPSRSTSGGPRRAPSWARGRTAPSRGRPTHSR